MGIFSNLFKSNKDKKGSDQVSDKKERSRYMPEEKMPADESFTYHFRMNGGRFLYSLTMDEVKEHFDNILVEHDWYEKDACCFDNILADRFSDHNVSYGCTSEDAFFLSTCEALVGADGSIMMSSRQMKEKKLGELPDFFIVFASTSQIVDNISEGMRIIKRRGKDEPIPSNITTIKHFKAKGDKDFLSYGSSVKTVYLLLLEDL